jgi:LPS sulfotransferase NodH
MINRFSKPGREIVLHNTRVCYLICATPRSGSNLLCEGLWNTNSAGRPTEYFLSWYEAMHHPERYRNQFGKSFLPASAESMQHILKLGTTPNGIFASKIMWPQLELVIETIKSVFGKQHLTDPEAMNAVFPQLRYVYIYRENKIRQAVSFAKAIQSKEWLDFDRSDPCNTESFIGHFSELFEFYGKTVKKQKISYDFDLISQLHNSILQQDQAWEKYFKLSGIHPFRVIYETLIENYEDTIYNILEFINVPDRSIVLQKLSMKRQSDSLNEEWLDRYQNDMRIRNQTLETSESDFK